MQRREQQRRTAGSGGSSYLGGGVGGYSPLPARFDAPETTTPVSRINTSPAVRSPAFKGSGMKLGSKKTKQAELLDALGGDVLASSAGAGELSGPPTPVVSNSPSPIQKDNGRGSLPEVEAERHVYLLPHTSISSLIYCYQRPHCYQRTDFPLTTAGRRRAVYGTQGRHESSNLRRCFRPSAAHPSTALDGLCREHPAIQAAPQCREIRAWAGTCYCAEGSFACFPGRTEFGGAQVEIYGDGREQRSTIE